MKRIFKTLFFVLVMSTTPLVFTSCDGLIGMIGDLMDQIENENDNGDGDDDGYNDENNNFDYNENYPSDMPSDKPITDTDVPEAGCPEILEFGYKAYGPTNLLEYCVNITHEHKYDIIGLEDCEWARVDWVEGLNGNDWTPLLTIDENGTGDVRSVEFTIFLNGEYIHHHQIDQHP